MQHDQQLKAQQQQVQQALINVGMGNVLPAGGVDTHTLQMLTAMLAAENAVSWNPFGQHFVVKLYNYT